MRDPGWTPWGEMQDCDRLCDGIYLVTAPGHGGIMVEQSATFYLSPAAQKCGFREGGYLCFEEDSQEQVVLRELLDKKLWSIPDRISDPAAFEKGIDGNIQMYHPDYWAARERAQAKARHPQMRPRRQSAVR